VRYFRSGSVSTGCKKTDEETYALENAWRRCSTQQEEEKEVLFDIAFHRLIWEIADHRLIQDSLEASSLVENIYGPDEDHDDLLKGIRSQDHLALKKQKCGPGAN
jgi:hypothetical protein